MSLNTKKKTLIIHHPVVRRRLRGWKKGKQGSLSGDGDERQGSKEFKH